MQVCVTQLRRAVVQITAHRQHLHVAVLSCIGLHRASGEVVVDTVLVLFLIKMKIPRFALILRVRFRPVCHTVEHDIHLILILLPVHIHSALQLPHDGPVHHLCRYAVEIIHLDRAVCRFPDRHKNESHIDIACHRVIRANVLRLCQHLLIDGFRPFQPLFCLLPAILPDHRLFYHQCDQAKIASFVLHHYLSSSFLKY